MTHDDAIQRVLPMGNKSRANGKGFTAQLAFYEVMGGSGRNRESPDVIFFRGDGVTDLIEVKVDRTDFLRDKKKLFRKHTELGMGTYRYYACPEHLITAQDLPDGWGLIWIPEKGEAYFKVKSAKFEANYLAERDLLFSLLKRIDPYVAVSRLVEYDKIVSREVAETMKPKAQQSDVYLSNLRKVRNVFWEKLSKRFKPHRR